MYEVVMINEAGKRFSKGFTSYYMYEKFLQKARRSKKVKIVSYGKI